MIAAQQGWTDGQILGAIGFLLFCAAVLAGLIVACALAANQAAYWWEDRHTEHDGHPDLVDRIETYTTRDEAAA